MPVVQVLSLQKAWTVADIRRVTDVLQQIQADRLTWVRAAGTPVKDLEELGEAFGLHPLAIEDVLHVRQRPKVEEYPDLTFIVLRVPRRGAEREWQQVGVFLGKDFVVTASAEPVPELDELQARLLSRGLPDERESAGHLLHMVLDMLVDAWFPFMDGLEDEIEDLEAAASALPSQEILAAIREMKRLASRTRKVSMPMREAMLTLERGSHPHLSQEHRVYIRDVSDHMVRLSERLDHVKEMALIAQETWNATLANQQNQVMKRLTVIAALLLFPGLVAGLGGMNFERGFPDWGYWPVVTGILAFIVLGFTVAAMRRWL